jgi:hypothetical protein
MSDFEVGTKIGKILILGKEDYESKPKKSLGRKHIRRCFHVQYGCNHEGHRIATQQIKKPKNRKLSWL